MNRIEAIKASVSIFDILQFYNIRYIASETHQIRCPFHEEEHPSARVYRDSQGVYCWVCGKFWDVVSFVQEKEETSFSEAMRFIEERFTIKPYSSDYADKIGALLGKSHKEKQGLFGKEREKLKDAVSRDLILYPGYRGVEPQVVFYLWDVLDENSRSWSYEDFKKWVKDAQGICRIFIRDSVKVKEFIKEIGGKGDEVCRVSEGVSV